MNEIKYKETTAFLISKEEFEFLKDRDGFSEHIVKHLSQELSDKLITILDKEDEIIVKQSEVRVREYKPINSVEYRRQIEWSPLVRCKDCIHNPNRSEFDNTCPFVDSDGCYVKEFPDDDGFCHKGEGKRPL